MSVTTNHNRQRAQQHAARADKTIALMALAVLAYVVLTWA